MAEVPNPKEITSGEVLHEAAPGGHSAPGPWHCLGAIWTCSVCVMIRWGAVGGATKWAWAKLTKDKTAAADINESLI